MGWIKAAVDIESADKNALMKDELRKLVMLPHMAFSEFGRSRQNMLCTVTYELRRRRKRPP